MRQRSDNIHWTIAFNINSNTRQERSTFQISQTGLFSDFFFPTIVRIIKASSRKVRVMRQAGKTNTTCWGSRPQGKACHPHCTICCFFYYPKIAPSKLILAHMAHNKVLRAWITFRCTLKKKVNIQQLGHPCSSRYTHWSSLLGVLGHSIVNRCFIRQCLHSNTLERERVTG